MRKIVIFGSPGRSGALRGTKWAPVAFARPVGPLGTTLECLLGGLELPIGQTPVAFIQEDFRYPPRGVFVYRFPIDSVLYFGAVSQTISRHADFAISTTLLVRYCGFQGAGHPGSLLATPLGIIFCIFGIPSGPPKPAVGSIWWHGKSYFLV